MTCSVPPVAGDVGAESHWQQGGWFTQQHAAARMIPVRWFFTSCWHSVCLGDVPRQTGSPNQGQHLSVFFLFYEILLFATMLI
jgi:hypothetical protein